MRHAAAGERCHSIEQHAAVGIAGRHDFRSEQFERHLRWAFADEARSLQRQLAPHFKIRLPPAATDVAMSTVKVQVRPRPGLQISTGVGWIGQRVRLDLEFREQSAGVFEQPHLDEICQLIPSGVNRSIELLDAKALNRAAAGRMTDEAFRPAREPLRLLAAATGHQLVDDVVDFFRSAWRHEFRIGAVVVPGERVSPQVSL